MLNGATQAALTKIDVMFPECKEVISSEKLSIGRLDNSACADSGAGDAYRNRSIQVRRCQWKKGVKGNLGV